MGRSLLGRKEDRHRREAAEVVGKPRRRRVALGARKTEGRTHHSAGQTTRSNEKQQKGFVFCKISLCFQCFENSAFGLKREMTYHDV